MPVVYRGYEREKLVLTVAGAITGLTKHEGKILKANAAEFGYFRQLYYGGKRLPLARFPNFDERTFDRNFDTSVLALPKQGTFGNTARYIMRGPGIHNWDAAIIKSFAMREPFRLQFRAEFYNAFNHTQFSAVDNTARFDAQGKQINTRFR